MLLKILSKSGAAQAVGMPSRRDGIDAFFYVRMPRDGGMHGIVATAVDAGPEQKGRPKGLRRFLAGDHLHQLLAFFADQRVFREHGFVLSEITFTQNRIFLTQIENGQK